VKSLDFFVAEPTVWCFIFWFESLIGVELNFFFNFAGDALAVVQHHDAVRCVVYFLFSSSMISSSFAVCTFLLSAIDWAFSVFVKHQNIQLPANLLQMHLRVMKRSFQALACSFDIFLCDMKTFFGLLLMYPLDIPSVL